MKEKNQNLTSTSSEKINSPESEDKEKDEIIEKQKTGISNIASPEGALMFCIAAILDGLGFILFLLSWLGLDDYGILDILGSVIFGIWLFITRGFNGLKKVLPKFLIAFGIELIPILGGASPSWIIFTYKVLKDG